MLRGLASMVATKGQHARPFNTFYYVVTADYRTRVSEQCVMTDPTSPPAGHRHQLHQFKKQADYAPQW